MNYYNSLELSSKYIMAGYVPGTLISKGTHSGAPSLTLIQDHTNKCKNATVPSAVKAAGSAPSAYVCDQDPAGDVSETDLQKSSVPGKLEQDKKQGLTEGQCGGSMKMKGAHGTWLGPAPAWA